MNHKEKLLILALSLAVSLLLIMFGTLIGATSFPETFSLKWTDVINSVAALMGALATLTAAAIAWLALTTWKHEHKWKESEMLRQRFEEAVNRYVWFAIEELQLRKEISLQYISGERPSEEDEAMVEKAKLVCVGNKEKLEELAEEVAFKYDDIFISIMTSSLTGLIGTVQLDISTKVFSPESGIRKDSENYQKEIENQVSLFVAQTREKKNEILQRLESAA